MLKVVRALYEQALANGKLQCPSPDVLFRLIIRLIDTQFCCRSTLSYALNQFYCSFSKRVVKYRHVPRPSRHCLCIVAMMCRRILYRPRRIRLRHHQRRSKVTVRVLVEKALITRAVREKVRRVEKDLAAKVRRRARGKVSSRTIGTAARRIAIIRSAAMTITTTITTILRMRTRVGNVSELMIITTITTTIRGATRATLTSGTRKLPIEKLKCKT